MGPRARARLKRAASPGSVGRVGQRTGLPGAPSPGKVTVMNGADPSRRRLLDAGLTVLMALLLLMSGVWGVLVIGTVRKSATLFAEMESVQLPTVTRWAIRMVEVPVAPGLMLALLLGGFATLFLVRDRVRALLGALAAAIAIGIMGLLLWGSVMVALARIVQAMGSQ